MKPVRVSESFSTAVLESLQRNFSLALYYCCPKVTDQLIHQLPVLSAVALQEPIVIHVPSQNSNFIIISTKNL